MTTHTRRIASTVAQRIEESPGLARVSAPLNSALKRIVRPGRLRDLASGTSLGHPLHPAVIVGPIGCWIGALVASLSGQRRASSTLTGAGLVLSVPAIATGASDWVDTTGAEQQTGLVHLCLALGAVATEGASLLARRRHAPRWALAFNLGGLGIITAASWLGGHLAYDLGVGVNTTAFEGGPTEWTPLERDGLSGAAGGVAMLVVEAGEETMVLADRCTHRGGPLSEGEVGDGCVTCPWHGSRFSLSNGEVLRGPASVPQPVYALRREEERLLVRRDEPRSLRVNPVRAPRS